MIITTKKSKLPPILLGLTWIIYSLFFTMYRPKDYLTVGIISIIVYLVSDFFLTKRVKLTSDIEKTGENKVDAAIEESLTSLYRVKDKGKGLDIEDKVNSIVKTGTDIYEYISKHPNQISQINTFTSYYMPTVEKLIDSYKDFSKKDVNNPQFTETKESIRSTLDVVDKAFKSLLSDLYDNKVLDIKTDIVVFEQMLDSEGLKE